MTFLYFGETEDQVSLVCCRTVNDHLWKAMQEDKRGICKRAHVSTHRAALSPSYFLRQIISDNFWSMGFTDVWRSGVLLYHKLCPSLSWFQYKYNSLPSSVVQIDILLKFDHCTWQSTGWDGQTSGLGTGTRVGTAPSVLTGWPGAANKHTQPHGFCCSVLSLQDSTVNYR